MGEGGGQVNDESKQEASSNKNKKEIQRRIQVKTNHRLNVVNKSNQNSVNVEGKRERGNMYICKDEEGKVTSKRGDGTPSTKAKIYKQ